MGGIPSVMANASGQAQCRNQSFRLRIVSSRCATNWGVAISFWNKALTKVRILCVICSPQCTVCFLRVMFLGTVCFMCAFVVGHSHKLAFTCFVLSTVGLTAAGSIPYGIVAVWNKAAEEAGHAGSVAMQMAILNCCITVGQQLCTMILGGLEGSFSVNDSLKGLYIISMIANALGGIGALFLTTGGKPTGKSISTTDSSESEESSETD